MTHPFPAVTSALLAAVGAVVTETEPAVPGLRDGLTEYDVSPGLLGFLVIFAAVLACIPLVRSMVGKIRGVNRREVPPPPDPGEVAARDAGQPAA